MFKMVFMNLQRYISEHFAKLLNSLPDDVEMLSETGCLNPIRIGNKSTYFYKDIKNFQKIIQDLTYLLEPKQERLL